MKTRYNLFPARRAILLDNFEPGITQQHFRDSCDVNNIVAKYTRTGILDAPRSPAGPADYGYAPSLTYFDALRAQRAATRFFEENPIPEAGAPADLASEGTTDARPPPEAPKKPSEGTASDI